MKNAENYVFTMATILVAILTGGCPGGDDDDTDANVRPDAGTEIDANPDDMDGDGILDADDGCPSEPEDKDSFEDTDGCPDPDNDADGILDDDDLCPDMAENINMYEDTDGCPDVNPDPCASHTDLTGNWNCLDSGGNPRSPDATLSSWEGTCFVDLEPGPQCAVTDEMTSTALSCGGWTCWR